MTIPRPPRPNRALLERVARHLLPLLEELVFVGGHLAELHITDAGAARPRVTHDVDVLVAVVNLTEYERIAQRLRALGLRVDPRDGAPICRWITPDGLAVDVMPTEPDVLGFANPWYPLVVETAVEYALAPRLTIRIATAPLFLATKWVAFQDRGLGDVLGSHDLEDILTVVAGRAAIVEEVRDALPAVRLWIARATAEFLKSDLAAYAIEGALPDAASSPAIVEQVFQRLQALASFASDR